MAGTAGLPVVMDSGPVRMLYFNKQGLIIPVS